MDKRRLMMRARHNGRREFERYPPEELDAIRAKLLGFPPNNAHVVGAWSHYRPSTASEEEYPGIDNMSVAQLRDIDESWLYGANQVLAPYRLAVRVIGKWLNGQLAIVKYERKYGDGEEDRIG